MDRQSIVVLRADAAVLIDWILSPEVAHSTGWVTTLVCSSNVRVAGTHNRRLLLPLHGLPHHPCWEARFSGRGGLAGPASCLVSGCYLLARRRGTPGSGIQSSVPPQKMDRQSIVVLRADAAVLIDWILSPEVAHSTGWVTTLVCSSNVRVAGTHNRRLLLPLHGLPHHPCWEARFSGRGGLAGPASCLVSGCYLLARRRGTPGSGIQSSVPPQRMDRQSIVVLRGDAAVLVDWILTSEAAYSQITNRLIDARFDTMPLGWALFCGYVGANFTFWMHSKRSQQQEGHRLSWKSLAGGRPSATPASYLVSGSHPVAWARDPSLWYFCYRPAPQELMSAEASSLEHRLEYGGQL